MKKQSVEKHLRTGMFARKNSPGFTLLECMIVLAIISLLAAITVPNLIRARTNSQISDCISNLRQLDGAIQQWALENNAGINSPVSKANIVPYLGRGSSGSVQSVFCPADTSKQFDNSYSLTDTGNKPTCQIVPTGTGAHVIN